MNTPAHLIIGAAAFAQPDRPLRNAAALFGALLPDLSLYLLVFWARNVQGVPLREIFGTLYFSDSWQQIFAVDNSFIVWGSILAVALVLRWNVLAVLAGVALLHIGLDFPLHHDDGRAHFWPLTDWIFESPVSYWDPGHYGHIVGPLEMLLCVGLLILLWRRFQSITARIFILLAGASEVLPALVFPFLFGGP